MEDNLSGICEMGNVAIIEKMMLIIVNSVLRGLRPWKFLILCNMILHRTLKRKTSI